MIESFLGVGVGSGNTTSALHGGIEREEEREVFFFFLLSKRRNFLFTKSYQTVRHPNRDDNVVLQTGSLPMRIFFF